MTIQELGSLGELLAAIATMATIAYLAVQLRQNTATVRASAAAAYADSIRMISFAQVNSAEVTCLYWDGLERRSELGLVERRRFDAFMSATTQTLEQMWKLNREGIVDDATWKVQETSIRFYASMPGFQEYWKIWGGGHHPDFGRLVDQVMAEPPLVVPDQATKRHSSPEAPLDPTSDPTSDPTADPTADPAPEATA